MGGHRLRTDLRRLPAPRRPGRGPARTAPPAHGRPGRLHHRIARRRCGHLRHVPDRDAGHAGARRRARAPRGPVDRDEHVHRGRRTQQGARHLGRGRRAGWHGWPPGWRHPHHLRRLAVHLLLQRPHRRSRPDPAPERGAREPGRQHTSALRPLRGHLDHRRPADLRLRHLRGAPSRLGSHPNHRHARRRRRAARRVLRHRDEGPSAPPPATAAPAAQCGRLECRRLPARDQLLYLRVPGHPLHAAGARLLRSGHPGRPG